jgi:N6-adenosine-specific RNA methylase IME4
VSELVKAASALERSASVTETALDLPEGLTEEQWAELGDGLRRLGQGYQWWIGDWLVAGGKRYGSTFDRAAVITGIEVKTLKEYKRTAFGVQKSNRMDFLSWTHHCQVAHLDSDEQKTWLGRALENRWSVSQLKSAVSASLRTDTSDPPPIPTGTFRVIEADPPWAVPSGPKGPGHQYELMPTDAICQMAPEVERLAADDCHLYLWATNTLLPDAVQVMEAWGFQHRTVLTWVKPRIGLGHHFRTTTEHVLFGTRGSLDTLVNDQPTHFEMPAGRHSAKPAEFYDLIERCSPGPYIRLFARDQRDGWKSWGAEAG